MATQRGLNAIRVGDTEFLLTMTAGDAIHLTRQAGPGETGQGAVQDWHLSSTREKARTLRQRYDPASLTEPRWAGTTLCGRPWIAMARDEEEEDSGEFGEDAVAPTCRRCLALMDKLFPEPVLDARFPLVVQLVTDTVVEHGYAEMRGVPGDHHAALRKHVRAAVRKRTGYGIQTFVHESMVVFVCEPIHDQHAAERSRMAAEAMNDFLTGESAPALPTPWRLSWDAWATG